MRDRCPSSVFEHRQYSNERRHVNDTIRRTVIRFGIRLLIGIRLMTSCECPPGLISFSWTGLRSVGVSRRVGDFDVGRNRVFCVRNVQRSNVKCACEEFAFGFCCFGDLEFLIWIVNFFYNDAFFVGPFKNFHVANLKWFFYMKNIWWHLDFMYCNLCFFRSRMH